MNRRNSEGYKDLTAHAAMTNVTDKDKVGKLMKTIFAACDKAGFRIEGRIVLVDKKSGKVWR